MNLKKRIGSVMLAAAMCIGALNASAWKRSDLTNTRFTFWYVNLITAH